jgi:hypothetical protein
MERSKIDNKDGATACGFFSTYSKLGCSGIQHEELFTY